MVDRAAPAPVPPPATAVAPAGAAPFIDEYLAYLLAQASHLISHEFHLMLRETGLTVLQWRVLATLADGQVASVGDVAQRILTPQPTVTRVVDRMRVLGLIARDTDPADRRVTRLRLTAQGLAIAADLVAQARAHEAAVLAPIGAPGAAALKDALLKLIATRLPPADRLGAADPSRPDPAAASERAPPDPARAMAHR